MFDYLLYFFCYVILRISKNLRAPILTEEASDLFLNFFFLETNIMDLLTLPKKKEEIVIKSLHDRYL